MDADTDMDTNTNTDTDTDMDANANTDTDRDMDKTSNKWKNKIVYELMGNQDCYAFTGFFRKDIIKHAEMCQLLPTDIFFMRVRIYRYFPYHLQETLFGKSATSLRKNFKNNIGIYEKRYAKRYLLNVLKMHRDNPYWTRETIKQCTPNFVNKLRGIQPDDDVLVLTQDETYQYIEHHKQIINREKL